MLRAEVNGLSVAYERTGGGPVLVLLHGFLLDSRVWRPQLESLSGPFTVIAWEAPGAGHASARPPRDVRDRRLGGLSCRAPGRRRGSTGAHPRSIVGGPPRPGVLPAPPGACSVACPGRCIHRLGGGGPR